MIFGRLMRTAALGLIVAIGAAPALAPGPVQAETLRVITGTASSPLAVPMNRAVVVESDTPFTEVSIANPGIADISSLSDRTIYLLGKEPGRTTLTILGADGQLITNVEVHVTPDIAEFKERLQQILPGEPIEVRTANDGIVLSGTVSSIARLDRALELAQRYAPDRVSNLMTVGGTQQVMLRVRFAEMNRTVSQALNSRFSLGSSGSLSGASTGVMPTGTPVPSTSGGAVLFGFNAGGLQVGLLLEALESQGMVRTLAEPNLTALSGQEARFLAGGEYPVPVSDGGTISVEYKPFGVELNFIPRVIDGDLINLELNAAVSSIDTANGVTLPNDAYPIAAFKRRETSTTVELRDGESFAIAGLLQDDFRDSVGRVPWLGDIPVLGALFRSAQYERAQTELVIIVTAHLVTPTRGEVLALPTDRVRPPSASDLFLFGRVEGRGGPTAGGAGEVARQDFSGSYGYVLD